MSIPSCIRPQRQPNGLVTGPLTGQMKPAADGVVSPGEYEYDDWAERICEASAALAACRPATSCRYSAFDSLTLRSASRLADARGREPVLAGQQLVAQRAHLVGADPDRAHLGRGERAEALRVLALHAHPFLRVSDLPGDRAVLRVERIEHLRGVDQVGDALRVEQHLERARLAVLVEVDQPVAEPVDHRLVLAAVEVEAARLQV